MPPSAGAIGGQQPLGDRRRDRGVGAFHVRIAAREPIDIAKRIGDLGQCRADEAPMTTPLVIVLVDRPARTQPDYPAFAAHGTRGGVGRQLLKLGLEPDQPIRPERLAVRLIKWSNCP